MQYPTHTKTLAISKESFWHSDACVYYVTCNYKTVHSITAKHLSVVKFP